MSLKVTHSIDLSFAEFLGLVAEYKLSISENSPLSILTEITQPESDLSRLEKEGLLNKKSDWYTALIAICNPDFIINSDVLFTSSSISSTYFANRANARSIVGCWPLDDKTLRISFPWSSVDILNNSLAAIVVNKYGSLSNTETFSFSVDGFITFCAAIDATRTVLLASTLQRQPFLFKLSRDNLEEMLQNSIEDKFQDNRWLVSLFHSYVPDFIQLSDAKISNAGVQELIDYELIEVKEDNYWDPAPVLIEIASDWLMPLPALHHEIVIIDADYPTENLHTLTLRGSGPLRLIELKESTDDKSIVTLRSLNEDDYWLYMTGQLMPPKLKQRHIPTVEKKPQKEVSKSIKNSSYSAIYKCPHCDALVEKDQKFCTECGTKLPEDLEAIQKESFPKRCPICGTELKEGAQFCTQCGAKVSD